jgi:hypothetical protein
MEETGKKWLAIVSIAFACIIYFFLCAVPLPKELVLEPRWSTNLPVPGAPSATGSDLGATQPLIPFTLGSSFGYFSPQGKVAFSAAMPFGLAISEAGYVAYDQIPTSLSLRSPLGIETAKTSEAGYPFYSGKRLFIMRPGQNSVAELGNDGRVLWQRDFPSLITAFSSSDDLAVFGLMDGSLVGLGKNGSELLSFAPGGSRIAGIYGCAVSPDGQMVAAISGLDKQRLIVLERRTSAYRVTYHRWLDSDFRRPVSMGFTEDGRYLAYERPDGFGIYSCEARSEARVATKALKRLGLSIPDRNMLIALEGGGEDKTLLCASPKGKRIFSASFSAVDGFLAQQGDALFLGMAQTGGASELVRLDLKEE